MKAKQLPAVFILFFFLGKINAQTSDTCRMKLGMNLFSIRTAQFNFDYQQPFANIIKGCDTFYTQSSTGAATTTNTNQLSLFSFDADGYPLQAPMSGISVCAQMLQGVSGNYPSGNYYVWFSGNGTLRFGGDASGADVTSGNGSQYVTVSTPTNNGIIMKIVFSDVSNPVRDIKVMMPNDSVSDTFNLAFINKITPFTALRFMEWNNMNTNTEVQWQNRRLPSYYTQGASGGSLNTIGIAWEYAIALCNQQQKDCWLSIPTQADTNYIIQLATLFRDNLNPNLKIYLEYSNECWNQLLSPTNYNWIDDPNNSSSTLTNHSQKTAFHFKKTFDLWKNVFGSAMAARVVRLCSGNDLNQGVSQMTTMMNYLLNNGSGADAISVAPYISPKAADYTRWNANCTTLSTEPTTILIDTLINLGRTRMNESMAWQWKFDTIAQNRNTSLVFYEGGPNIAASTVTCTAIRTAITAMQSDVRIYNLYNEWLDSVRTLSKATLFNHFVLAGSGVMGALTNIYQTTSQKYSVLTDYINFQNSNCSVTGFAENYPEENSFVYPNPSNGNFFIELQNNVSGKIKMEMFNTLGEKVYSEEKNALNQKIIFVENVNLQDGIYFLKITYGNKIHGQKIIITN
ncbi:MAG: T9SS type A sorting domain-containing protein [Bacteroidetes bacterium]|nr:T9SS type A sorting domain-containing protein [Bacteroidota bacterium]